MVESAWQILEEMPVFYNLNPPDKREILVCMLHFLHHLDDASLIKAWQQSAAQTRLFFKLLEECQNLFEVRFLSKGTMYSITCRAMMSCPGSLGPE